MTPIACQKCGKRCRGNVLRVGERYFHKECFRCSECGCSVETGGFFEREGRIFCSKDYQQRFCVRCHICERHVDREVVSALNRTFHKECFRCTVCGKYFHPGDRVTLFSSRFYCTQCVPPASNKERRSTSNRGTFTNTSEDETDEGVSSPRAALRHAHSSTLASTNSSLSSPRPDERNGRTSRSMIHHESGLPEKLHTCTTDGGYTSGDSCLPPPPPPPSATRPFSLTRSHNGVSALPFGQHITQSYLKLQERNCDVRSSGGLVGVASCRSSSSGNKPTSFTPHRERSQSPHFHRPPDVKFSYRQPSVPHWRKCVNSMSSGYLSECLRSSGDMKQPNSLGNMSSRAGPGKSISGSSSLSSSGTFLHPVHHHQHASKLSPVKEQVHGILSHHDSDSCCVADNLEDPLKVAVEARQSSQFPSGRPRDYPVCAAIERDDWPAPPEPAVFLAERAKERERRRQQPQVHVSHPGSHSEQRSQATTPRSTGQQQQQHIHMVHSHSGHFASTGAGNPLRGSLRSRQTTSELSLPQQSSRKSTVVGPSHQQQSQRYHTRFADEAEARQQQQRDTTVTSTSGFEDGTHSGERDGCSSCTGATTADMFLECSSVADSSDFTVSSSCYEDARSMFTDAGVGHHDSGMAKAILWEQSRSKSCHLLPLDPVSASRTPSASVEPKLKTRYARHEFASPSRDTCHVQQDSRYRLGYPMDYINVGNRHFSTNNNVGVGSASSSTHAINSMANALQQYDEIRPTYMSELQPMSHNTNNKTTSLSFGYHHPELTTGVSKIQMSSFTSSISVSIPGGGTVTDTQPPTASSVGGGLICGPGVGPLSAGISDWDEEEEGDSIVSLGGDYPCTVAPMIVAEGLAEYRGLRPRIIYPPSAGARGRSLTGANSMAAGHGGGRRVAASSSSGHHHRSVASLPPMALNVGRGHRDTTPLQSRERPSTQQNIAYTTLTTFRHQPHKGIDPTRLESYLSDEDFNSVFHMSREAFYVLPEWKRSDLKRRVHLF